MNDPKISVILPVYNSEKYLKEAVDSILNQTVKNFELIIINDGSTDKSEEIIKSYNDSRIKLISNPKNLKIIKSLNIGLEIAKGEYISRMDADDIAFTNMFEKQLRVFEENPNIDIVNIQSFLMTNNGKSYRKSNTVIKVNFDVHQHVVFFQNLISHPGVMVKSSLIKKHLYNKNEVDIPFQDVDLWYRILKTGAYCYTTDERLLYYRNTATGITNTKREGRRLKRMEYCKRILDKEYANFFSDREIELILGNYNNVSYRLLIDLNKNLSKYIEYLEKNKNLTKSGLVDLRFWKTNLIFFTSIKSLNKKQIKNSLFVSLFIAVNIPQWIFNKKWSLNLIDILISKKYRHRKSKFSI